MAMTFGSLFAGIGGFDIGLERAGMTCKWQVEIDDFATRVLERHWPHVQRFRDVRQCGGRNLPAVDLICGGFPCQPFSVAGKRRGTDDDRNLWPEMRRVVAELRPAWVVAENVPGIAGLYLDTVLSDLEGLGYEVGTVEVPACAFGAPHIRQRLLIIANAAPVFGIAIERHESDGLLSTDDPDADGGRLQVVTKRDGQSKEHSTDRDTQQLYADGLCDALADPNRSRSVVSRSIGEQAQDAGSEPSSDGGEGWQSEPGVGRVAHGVPHRVDRLRCLGNAIVPQMVEWIGRIIVAAEAGT